MKKNSEIFLINFQKNFGPRSLQKWALFFSRGKTEFYMDFRNIQRP